MGAIATGAKGSWWIVRFCGELVLLAVAIVRLALSLPGVLLLILVALMWADLIP